ncbi:MAG TPA: formimidoylglutamate deiminase [Nocardioidaceae bacterium]|nr:formimidoylglutamate deiminase [Nocardioidaceae bacterium]
MKRTYWLERAWLGRPHGAEPVDEPVDEGVLVSFEGSRFTSVETGVAIPPGDARTLPGLTIPGMANAHSHAFHRALRGRTQRERGSFWTWREQMYGLASRITPDTYFELARAVYREMVAAGFTTVGEFHYLHHGPDGTPYDDPNAMGQALVEAAREAGIRIGLLDTCYLAAGIGQPTDGVQLRFSDGSAERWAARLERLEFVEDDDDVVLGAAVHSVRAVPLEDLREVVAWAEQHRAPLHFHLSEQVAENDASLAAYGMTPTEVLADAGALGCLATAVHATHLTATDTQRLGAAGAHVCFCPTTERDLGDGIGPSRALDEAGAQLTLGSDSHAVIDPFEEMRAVELDERLATRQRGHWAAEELLLAATRTGQVSLGFDDAGVIAVGAPADLVTLDTASPATAGTGGSLEAAVFAAGASDVVHVVAQGRVVATRESREDLGRELDAVISRIWRDA